MKPYIKVEGSNNLVRDRRTGAILNVDKNEIAHARALKEARKKKDKEIEELKNEVSEIKSLLNQLIEKL